MKKIFTLLFLVNIFPVVAFSEGQCTSDDIRYHLQENNHAFSDTWAKCGRDAWGAAKATTQCIMEAYPTMTQNCASCFGNYAGCARSNCWFSCLGGSTPVCEACVKDNCVQSLEKCTGVSYAKLPSRSN